MAPLGRNRKVVFNSLWPFPVQNESDPANVLIRDLRLKVPFPLLGAAQCSVRRRHRREAGRRCWERALGFREGLREEMLVAQTGLISKGKGWLPEQGGFPPWPQVLIKPWALESEFSGVEVVGVAFRAADTKPCSAESSPEPTPLLSGVRQVVATDLRGFWWVITVTGRSRLS